ncbi:hypothetical protein D4740_02220 [Actinomyces sp. 2119]|uniref:A-factor biosynthesis hotdog domain-containing protein n=1 Tax=Actinomyces lilanjuaniae TaxID=2321394 RepID=A0ABN5PLW0_9ACTO|nr:MULTISPECIES: AfsA-related hotdog domain-containing protein [Actinomyces]AYD88884.1 hypothetical protein D5R93_00295 [Actinomyces lilanjuaniae]RJF43809.1 hypothetical protein D4740_02220 [Actinomyces sp. 2119]
MAPQAATVAPQNLVHRQHEQEVLVSAPTRLEDGLYESAPGPGEPSPYYQDHPHSYWADVLFLAELGRQAGMSAGHAYAGLSLGTAFFFNSVMVEILDLPRLNDLRDRPRVRTRQEVLATRKDGTPRQLVFSQEIIDPANVPLARTKMEVQGLQAAKYEEIRRYQRGGSQPPQTSTVEVQAAPGAHVLPSPLLGREDRSNVVVSDLECGPGRSHARLSPDFANTSLFDHDYDHYPAMVLIEAGRQVTVGSASGGSGFPVVTRVSATFPGFAELDAVTTVSAQECASRFEVSVEQNGSAVSSMQMAVEWLR